MIILIDNYDSFTFNIYHYLSEIGAKVRVYRNDEININKIRSIKPKALVISPGPCTPNEAGNSIKIIKNLQTSVPILGICLGHQCIGQGFGGKIVRCKEIMHGKIDNIVHNKHLLFKEIPINFKATRYHSLIIENSSLPKDFNVIAKTKKGIIMGIAHKKSKIFGLQFHPESIGTIHGQQILRNFLKIINYDFRSN